MLVYLNLVPRVESKTDLRVKQKIVFKNKISFLPLISFMVLGSTPLVLTYKAMNNSNESFYIPKPKSPRFQLSLLKSDKCF